MCYCVVVQVLVSADVGEDAECHAAKLLEVILLQFKGSIDHVSSSSSLFITSWIYDDDDYYY